MGLRHPVLSIMVALWAGRVLSSVLGFRGRVTSGSISRVRV